MIMETDFVTVFKILEIVNDSSHISKFELYKKTISINIIVKTS